MLPMGFPWGTICYTTYPRFYFDDNHRDGLSAPELGRGSGSPHVDPSVAAPEQEEQKLKNLAMRLGHGGGPAAEFFMSLTFRDYLPLWQLTECVLLQWSCHEQLSCHNACCHEQLTGLGREQAGLRWPLAAQLRSSPGRCLVL